MEGYNTLRADTAIAVGGQQNLSFSFTSPAVQQRIDRIAKLGGNKLAPAQFCSRC